MDTQKLETKRKLFETEGDVFSFAQVRRFKNRIQLLKGTLEFSTTSTISRKVLLKQNLERIASFSSALLVLCTVISEEVLASQFDISKLQDWWRGVPYPSNLKIFVQKLYEETGLDYIETVHKTEFTIALFHNEAVVLRAFAIHEYWTVTFTMSMLIAFLRNYQGISDPLQMIDFLESYESNCPNLILKFPSHGVPSFEIVVPHAQNLICRFDWVYAIDFVNFLGLQGVAANMPS